ncbi:hypothetical protein Bhyg_09094 [Pseudolycoriella hygida]|uniref:Uncharacterized protein n=1 Tax=Pseudolycoriella hygida TaxID=35572 RepID=A0A9Q0S4Y3_9DIPT|nr:hypothetical protein Bhyg_09094 [Pseudolycoriella hygida]
MIPGDSRYFDCDDSDTCSEQSYSGDYENDLFQLNANENGTERKSDEPLSPTDKIGDDTSLSYCESLSDLSTDDGSERDKVT